MIVFLAQGIQGAGQGPQRLALGVEQDIELAVREVRGQQVEVFVVRALDRVVEPLRVAQDTPSAALDLGPDRKVKLAAPCGSRSQISVLLPSSEDR